MEDAAVLRATRIAPERQFGGIRHDVASNRGTVIRSTTRPLNAPSRAVVHHVRGATTSSIPKASALSASAASTKHARGELRQNALGATTVTRAHRSDGRVRRDVTGSTVNEYRRQQRRISLQRRLDRENFLRLQDHVQRGLPKETFIPLTLLAFVRLVLKSPQRLLYHRMYLETMQFTASGAWGRTGGTHWGDDMAYDDWDLSGEGDAYEEGSGEVDDIEPQQQKPKRKRSKRGVCAIHMLYAF